jgi:hypothetical protein
MHDIVAIIANIATVIVINNIMMGRSLTRGSAQRQWSRDLANGRVHYRRDHCAARASCDGMYSIHHVCSSNDRGNCGHGRCVSGKGIRNLSHLANQLRKRSTHFSQIIILCS